MADIASEANLNGCADQSLGERESYADLALERYEHGNSARFNANESGLNVFRANNDGLKCIDEEVINHNVFMACGCADYPVLCDAKAPVYENYVSGSININNLIV